MIIRGLIAAILTVIIGGIILALVMPLILPADALNESADGAGRILPLIGVIVGVIIAVRHKKRTNQSKKVESTNDTSDVVMNSKSTAESD